MATLIENVNRIYTDKEAIKQAIIGKGVGVPDGTSLDDYAGLIAQINSGVDVSGVTAAAADVLSGKVIVDASGNTINGTMPNHGAKNAALNCGGSYTIPAGYHNGSGKITANSLASQTSATATVSQILSGKTAWVNGSKVTGTIASKAAATYTPGTANQTIAAGQYLSGAQTIKGDANLTAANILLGKSIFGITGTGVPGGYRKVKNVTKNINTYLKYSSGSALYYTISIDEVKNLLGFSPIYLVCRFNVNRANKAGTALSGEYECVLDSVGIAEGLGGTFDGKYGCPHLEKWNSTTYVTSYIVYYSTASSIKGPSIANTSSTYGIYIKDAQIIGIA